MTMAAILASGRTPTSDSTVVPRCGAISRVNCPGKSVTRVVHGPGTEPEAERSD